MKIITNKQLSKELLGTREHRFSYTVHERESPDGMLSGYSYTVQGISYKTLENEQQNEDGTYSYDYTVKTKLYDMTSILIGENSEYDRKSLAEDLIFEYNIHEFRTDLQEEPFSIKDYYLDIDAVSKHEKGSEPSIIRNRCSRIHKDRQYSEYTNQEVRGSYNDFEVGWIKIFNIKAESIEELNKQLDSTFSKNDYILYLIGDKAKKNFRIKLGFDEIGEDETIDGFLSKISLAQPKTQNIQEALENEEITIDDIEKFISEHQNINATEIPSEILEEIFQRNPKLIQNFTEKNISSELLRKYNPNFDISKISPSQLLSTDLDAVLEQIKTKSIYGIYGIYSSSAEKERKEEYLKYLEQFYDNPNALRKIISAINTTPDYFFLKNAQDYINNIPDDVLNQTEIRDIMLEASDLPIEQLLSYKFEYDEQSSAKLLEVLANSQSSTDLSTINSIIEIAKQNSIDNKAILQALQINGFNITASWTNEEITKFKELGVTGIPLDYVRDIMIKTKNFNFINLSDSVDEGEITREYYSILNESSRNSGKRNGENQISHNEIFDLICNYSNCSELLSRLTPEVKQLSKQLLIDNLDVIEELQKAPVGSEFSEVMQAMAESFDLSQENLTTIYMKCLNNGASQQYALNSLKEYIPEEERKSFEDRISASNIYPSPKYFWLANKNLRRIHINRGENRGTIKNKIQADGRCFSTKVKTDMDGISKEGKKIPINNLSKWLFGVPGTKGNLTITRSGDYIQLPGNTPDEAVELIKSILQERTMNAHSRD